MSKQQGRSRRWRWIAGLAVLGVTGAAVMALRPTPVQFEPGEAVTRRISAEQYENIVRDLFGDDIELGGRFEPEMRMDGLYAIGASHVSISPTGMEQYDAMGRTVAAQVVDEAHRDVLLPCKPQDASVFDEACARAFLQDVGLLLYRRPLTTTQLDSYVAAASEASALLGDFYQAVGLSLAAMLASPSFLFFEEVTEPDPGQIGRHRLDGYSKASQLSFFLWNSAPDTALLDAAGNGELHTRRGLRRQVDRMLDSPRLEAGLRAFFADNYLFSDFETLAKDGQLFPKFSAQVAADAREQTLRTIMDVVLHRDADFREIFTTRRTFLTPELASVYRVPLFSEVPNGAPEGWHAFEFAEDDPRGGILTQVAFTALHSPAGRSSPTLRGKALREVVLCQKVPAPPGDIDFTQFEDLANAEGSTARERLTAHSSVPSCAGCHKIMDPIGLAMEHFDGIGELRLTDNGAPIDPSGDLDGTRYNDADGLTQAVAQHPAATSCVVERLSARALGRLAVRGERPWLKQLNDAFGDSGYRLRELLREISLSDALYTVAPVEPAAESVAALSAASATPLLEDTP